MPVPVAVLARLFESKLLTELIDDPEFDEKTIQSQQCKRAIEVLRIFLASNCTKYNVFTYELLMYLDSPVLDKIYRLQHYKSLTHTELDDEIVVIIAADAANLLDYMVGLDYEHINDMGMIACEFDSINIMTMMNFMREFPEENVKVQAYRHDSPNIYKFVCDNPTPEFAVKAMFEGRIKIANIIMTMIPNTKLDISIHIVPTQLEYIKFYLTYAANVNIPQIQKYISDLHDSEFKHVEILLRHNELKIDIPWDAIFINACRNNEIYIAELSAPHVKDTQPGVNAAYENGNMAIIGMLFEAGIPFGLYEPDEK